MSDHDCPLWPEVRQLRQGQARLDARVHALELRGEGPQVEPRPVGVVDRLVRRLIGMPRGRAS